MHPLQHHVCQHNSEFVEHINNSRCFIGIHNDDDEKQVQASLSVYEHEHVYSKNDALFAEGVSLDDSVKSKIFAASNFRGISR